MGSSVLLSRSCAPPSTVLLFFKGGNSISEGEIPKRSSISSPSYAVETFFNTHPPSRLTTAEAMPSIKIQQCHNSCYHLAIVSRSRLQKRPLGAINQGAVTPYILVQHDTVVELQGCPPPSKAPTIFIQGCHYQERKYICPRVEKTHFPRVLTCG